jgi:hypothetical protein
LTTAGSSGAEGAGELRTRWNAARAQDRLQLLELLPKGGTVGEVGVFQGQFSRRIWEIARPARLHLVDPWIHQEIPLWKDKSNDFHFDCMRKVQRRFEAEIARRQVLIHQGFSLDVLPLFPDGYFDWIYLDGDHRYDTVRAELALCDRKVKPGGLILGHDYIKPEIYPVETQERLGVVPAVRDFCASTAWEFVFQTPDQPRGSKQCPSFVLIRGGSSGNAHRRVE